MTHSSDPHDFLWETAPTSDEILILYIYIDLKHVCTFTSKHAYTRIDIDDLYVYT